MALLKAADRVSDQLNLLPETRRSEIQSALDELRDVPESELRSGWEKAREQEARSEQELAARRTRLPVRQFSPALQRWLSQRF